MVRGVALLVLLVAAAFAGGPSADAAAPLVYVTKNVTVPGGVSGTAIKAVCPEGTQVVGGGVKFDVAQVGLQAVASSAPFDSRDRGKKPDDGWVATVNNKSSVANVVRVVAVCARARGHAYIDLAFSAIEGPVATQASVACPGGTEVSGGGVSVSGRSPFLELGSTSPIDTDGGDKDNGWAVAVHNDSGANVEARLHAICTPFDLLYASIGPTNQGPGVISAVSQGCAANRAIGGGIEAATPHPDYEIVGTAPFDDSDPDSRPDDGWQHVIANGTGVTQSRTITRICLAL